MQNKSDMQKGWEFSTHLIGADVAVQAGSQYVAQVEKAIEDLTLDILKLKSNQSDAVLGGYIAEHWHAGTFNVDAVAAGSISRATTLGSTDYASVDVRIDTGASTIDYSSKYMSTGEKSAVAQAAYSHEMGQAKYHGQDRLIPSDHMEEALSTAQRRALSNEGTRPEVAASYREAHDHFTDRITDGEIESKPLSKEDDLQMARDLKNDEFSTDKYGENVNSAIKTEYLFKQAAKAGLTTAALTMAIQLAPEIYKAIDYLIKNKQINLQHLKEMGKKAISSGAEGFLRGSISCSVLIMCEKGLLGEAFKSINPTMLGTVVAVVLETVKNSLLVAAGKMTPKAMGAAFADSIVVSAGFVIGTKIGGIIGQALGFQLPVVGYLIGSLVGSACAVVYNIGKRKLISFCIDSGFTCFGLVDQNYELPEEVLLGLGVDLIPISKAEVSRTPIKNVTVSANINRTNYETIDIKFLRRGVIGVNKIGYMI